MRHTLLILIALLTMTGCEAQQADADRPLRTGAEELMASIATPAESTADMVQDLRNPNAGGVAVVGNQTSLVGTTHLVDTLLAKGIHVTKIFCPEHGFRGTAAAGAKVDNSTDPATGLPIISLYGNNKKPSAEQMRDVSAVIFDLQDVGCRFYTYISTLHYVMEACAEANVPLIVLDRPNPNGHYVDGPVLDTSTYMGSGDKGRKIGALDFLIGTLMEKYSTTKRYFDFGISNENEGRFLNEGLCAQKEDFGGRTVAYDQYKLDLTK